MISTLIANIKFELTLRYKSLSTYVYFIMFFTLSILMTLAAGGAFAGATVSFGLSNKVFFNSNLGITLFLSLLSAFSLFITTPAFGQAIVKDYANKFDQIIYSTPVSRRLFLTSRFLAAVVFMFFILLSLGLGIWVTSFLPMVLQTSVTDNKLYNYILPYLTVILPNIFIFGSLAFLLASRTKKMAPVYVMTVVVFMGWMLSGSLLGDVENKLIGTLVDPFGINAILQTTKYWSADQQNNQMLSLQSYFLYNRLLWVSIGVMCFVLSLNTFNLSSPLRKKQKKSAEVVAPKISTINFENVRTLSNKKFGFWSAFGAQVFFEYKQIFRSIYFRVLLLAGVCYMFIAGQQVGKMFGTHTLPVTYIILDIVGGTFNLFILIIITMFAGEVVWRDRDQKTQQVIDSYPVTNNHLIFAKIANLVLMVATLLFMVLVCGTLIQLFKGYTHFEWNLYVRYLYGLRIFSFINIILLAFFFQVILNNKYLAHGAMILFYISSAWLPSLGLDHKLYLYNSSGTPIYSDMNGFGHFLSRYFTFQAYWFSFALFLLGVSFLFWQRGNLSNASDRVREARRRLTGRMKGALLLSLCSFTGFGSYLFYNTNILNTYVSSKTSEKRNIDYEKKYSSYKYTPQLQIIGTKAFVDIFPQEIAANLKYIYTLKNKHHQPIGSLFLNIPSNAAKEIVFHLTFDQETTLDGDDEELGVRFYKFNTPVAPGETVELTYTARVQRPGISNANEITKIAENGTFFNNFDFAPIVGYAQDREITETKTREKYGLTRKERVPEITNEKERQFTYISSNSTWTDFEAIVSTDIDQIAIAPGYLQKTWVENNRKYFSYKMDQKILNFFAFLSGRYDVATDKWNDVNIEVYHHHAHKSNIEKMIAATKDGLEYFTKNFGPYQHKQFRILEFPRYENFAQAFPNTIPYSEAIGFIADVDPNDPKDVDYPVYITAHELAHQWWAHQAIGANVQGSTMLSESFSQYSALMVMQKKFGRENMKRFLRYELERYLNGRGEEDEYEMPLSLNENQSYIYYQKGSLALFALKEYLGEEVVNKALKTYLNKVKFQDAPFTVSTEFLEVLKSIAPADKHPLIVDLLEKIVLFENKPLEAKAKKLADGRYEVELKISATKIYADKDGKETVADFSQEFDVGVTDAKDNYLYLKKHLFKQGENTIKVVVDGIPSKAGIDPLNYIIDRTPDDNMMSVSL
jgi:ABC-2 type transport system permease protein